MDNVHDMAVFCHDMIMPAMQDLRDPIDRLELIVEQGHLARCRPTATSCSEV